jgi:endonuclease/exonuclease/phosphatase family metal-dependent hydrolase
MAKQRNSTVPSFSCVTWNIHRGRGEDGMVDPARTLDVLCSEVCADQPEALFLQEADEETPPHRGFLDIDRLETETGLRSVHVGPDHRWGDGSHGFLGVITFLHPAFAVENVTLLDLPGHCHRGAVIVDARKDGCPLRLIATHLSLTQVLRMAQLRTLGQHLFRRIDRPTVLCGDLNEWRPWGGLALSSSMLGARFAGTSLATFPNKRPILPLDRVLARGGARVTQAQVLDGPGIRMASDHRPLAATILVDS